MNALATLALVQEAAEPVKSAAEQRLHVFGDYALADPWFLLAIPLGAFLLWIGRAAHARDRGRVPVLPESARPPVARRGLVVVPVVPAFLALVATVIARYAVLPALLGTPTGGAGSAAALAPRCTRNSLPRSRPGLRTSTRPPCKRDATDWRGAANGCSATGWRRRG